MASRMVRSPKTLRKMYPLSPLAVTYSRDSTVQRFIQSEKHSENGYYTISATFMKMDAHGNLVPIHTWIAFDYLCTMAAASYMTDALQFDKAGHVLSIGLGGASLDMFFHARQPRLKITVVELDPTMEDLARKWFGAVEDERRRTVIGDGAEFVRKAAEEGAKYDVIALDACDTADEVFRCPAKVFYEAETMRSMREALTEKGILVMNLLSSNTTILRTTVKQHFPACFLAHMNNDNLVVACAKKAPQEPVMEKFKGALKALGLGNRKFIFEMGVPAECDLSIPFPPHMAETTEKTRRTVRAVKNIQRRTIDLEAKYFQRLQEVDQEFQPLFDKLHEERHAFVTGAKEPTDEEANISLFHDVDKEELEKLEQQWNKDNPEKGERGIPEFWLHALMNFPPTSDMICGDDARLLARLNDITCAIETAPPAFTLRFHFDRNEYFTNSVLEKRYVLDITPDPEHPFSFDGPHVKEITGTKIDWYEGKNITKKVIKTRYRTKVGGMKTSIKTVKQDSFFNFFEAPPKPADKDDFEALDAMEHDYTIGDEIREDLIPRAVLFYTAEITEDEESDDQFDDLDLVDDEDEGDEDGDENEAEG